MARKKINKFGELKELVIIWAKEKEILSKANPLTQSLKTQEEALELTNAIVSYNRDEVIDAIGDIVVTLIIQAEMQGLTIEDCLESAYNVIKNRTGVMKNGQFLKDK